MQAVFDSIYSSIFNFFAAITLSQVLLYLTIFFAKMVEVILATIRVVLINRGEKLKGALIGFFEVMIWVTLASEVIKSITDDPLKIIAYCLAFSCGNYLGVVIENKLAIGTSSLQVIVPKETEEILCAQLRKEGFGVTTIKGTGKDGPVAVFLIYVKRKTVSASIKIIREYSPQAIITVNDVRQLKNGYLKK